MTERRFWLLVKRHELREQRQDYRAGTIAALLFNANRDPEKSEPKLPHDFFPTLPKPKQPRKRRQSAASIFRALMWGQGTAAAKILGDVKSSRNGTRE